MIFCYSFQDVSLPLSLPGVEQHATEGDQALPIGQIPRLPVLPQYCLGCTFFTHGMGLLHEQVSVSALLLSTYFCVAQAWFEVYELVKVYF